MDAAPLRADVAKLQPLLDEGWVEFAGDRLTIREHATLIARVVASAFDAYLGAGGARHSTAV